MTDLLDRCYTAMKFVEYYSARAISLCGLACFVTSISTRSTALDQLTTVNYLRPGISSTLRTQSISAAIQIPCNWMSLLQILIMTLKKSIPNMLRFLACAAVFYMGFTVCGWVVLGPYHIKVPQYPGPAPRIHLTCPCPFYISVPFNLRWCSWTILSLRIH